VIVVSEYLRDGLGNVTGLKYPDGEIFDGELDFKSNPSGFGILKDADGNIICEGYFNDDVYDYIKRYKIDMKRIYQSFK
jgi:hypothetical protein